MFWSNCLTVFATLTIVTGNDLLNPFLTDEYISEINSKQSLWTAGRNFDPNTPVSHLHSLSGVNGKLSTDHLRETAREFPLKKTDDIRESFDAREQWPNCTSIATVTDESACSAAWVRYI